MKYCLVVSLLIMTGSLFADNGEWDAIIGKFDYTASEKKTLVAIWNDAKNKGLDRTELTDVLREQFLKKASYYETVESLNAKLKEIDIVRNSGFPFLDRSGIRSIAYVLVRMHTVKQFNSLASLFGEKSLAAGDIEALFRFDLDIVSFGVSTGDAFLIVNYLVQNGSHDQQNLDSIKGLYLRSRDLRLDRKRITRELVGGLGRGQLPKNIVYKIRSSSRGD